LQKDFEGGVLLAMEEGKRVSNERTLSDLEFARLKEIVKEFAASPLGVQGIEELTPSADRERVADSLAEVEECIQLLRRKDPLRLGEMHDLEPHFERAREHPPLGEEDFLDIARTLTSGAEVKRYVLGLEEGEREDLALPHMRRLIGEIGIFDELMQSIRSKIDRRGKIRDDASPTLRKLIQQKREAEESVKERLEDFLDRNRSFVQDRVVARRSHRLVVPLKSSARNEVDCVIHESSNSGRTLFAEPSSAVELNNRVRDLTSEIREEKNRILRELTEELQKEERAILRTQRALKRLDSDYGRARFAVEYSCHPPRLTEDGELNLLQARHPLLDQEEVVPIDIGFGGAGDKGAVITGPNTGGKTVTLKTIGLFALMVQSGIPIPASVDSKIGVYNHIYSDVGDEQSIEQSLSTFSSHMNNIVKILKGVNARSMVLLDELGAGTDPREGAALGLGLLEHLLNAEAHFAITTHFTAIKNFAFNHDELATFSVDFDPEELVPTYHILEGVPGRSNAFIIASRLGLSDEIIERAEEFLGKGEIKAEDIIEQLSEEKRKIRDNRQEMEEELEEAQNLRDRYQRKLEKLREDKRNALSEQMKEIDDFLERTRKEIEEVIAQAREDDLTEEEARDRYAQIRDLEDQADRLKKALRGEGKDGDEERKLAEEELREGKKVKVKSAGEEGVIEKVKNGERVEVRVNGIKLETTVEDLAPLRREKGGKKEGAGGKADYESVQGNVELELNVRGMTVREALREVDLYLDRLLRADREKGRILHGKGTGKLRRSIRKHLRGIPWVDRCYAPPRGEGGEGVTVVEL